MKKGTYLLFFVCAGYILCGLNACNQPISNQDADNEVPDTVSYNFNIRPIFSDKCFKCHGPDANKRQAGLRLDIAEEALKALKDDPTAHALIPGDPSSSQVYLRITSADSSVMMPPPASNLKRLTPHETDLVKRWIKQGAKYEKHWAFVPLKEVPVPDVKNKAWPKNQLDYFVLSKLEKRNIAPNAEADKERLLKRICFDITGLPPSLQLMDNFLADHSSNAYEKAVDQLLQSPVYGEKMTLHWLDVARYADSHGYQDDNYRSQWPWRDWVIHAFNENLSYDKFITWQLAGDLLPIRSNCWQPALTATIKLLKKGV
jgi:hypothetical protein